MNIKRNDNVVVLAGKDKGKTGKVLVVNPQENTAVVQGVNIICKNQKPKKAGEKGGIMKREGKVDASNLQIICPVCGKATRVAHGMEGDKKFRKCKKCGASLDKVVAKKEVKKAVAKEATVKSEVKPAKKVSAKSITSATAEKTTVKKTATKKSAEKKED